MRGWWVGIVGAGLAVFVWNTGAFQRTFFPMSYWGKQATITRGVIALNLEMLRVTEGDLAALRPESTSEADGMAYEIRRDILRKEIDMWREALAYDRAALEEIRAKSLE